MEKNKIENINLHDLVENQDNPRSIEPQQMQKLVESILTFPKMLQMRPIVCNENRVILGGNMRFRALLNIEQMEDEVIKNAIETVAVKLTDGEKQQLCSHWEKWKAEPKVEVVMADSLSEEETDEFIIKDNVYFGSWDAENLLRARLEKAMNLGTREKYSKYYTMSAADYMKWCWNNPQAAHSPYKMFEGAMLPADERDSEGNIVYKYNGAKF